MKTFVGIDLGSPTTKAVLLDDDRNIIGRGITNSRSNYATAARVAGQEARVDARFTLFHRALAEKGGAAGIAFADLSTGEFRATEFSGAEATARLQEEIERMRPREVLLASGGSPLDLPPSGDAAITRTSALSVFVPPTR